jgi:hypothetical protein
MMTSPLSLLHRRAGIALLAGLCAVGSAWSQAAAAGAETGLMKNGLTENGLKEVAELAQVNGEALACQDPVAMRRAKSLMLAHAPKTARYATAYDDGTQQAFLSVTRAATGCSEPTARAARLDQLAQRLQQVLPASGHGGAQ